MDIKIFVYIHFYILQLKIISKLEIFMTQQRYSLIEQSVFLLFFKFLVQDWVLLLGACGIVIGLMTYGTLFNGTKEGYSGPVQVPQSSNLVTVLAGYPTTGDIVDIMAYNPPR